MSETPRVRPLATPLQVDALLDGLEGSHLSVTDAARVYRALRRAALVPLPDLRGPEVPPPDQRLAAVVAVARYAYDFHRLSTYEFVQRYGACWTTRDLSDRIRTALEENGLWE